MSKIHLRNVPTRLSILLVAGFISFAIFACATQSVADGSAAGKSHTLRLALAAHNMENFFDIYDDAYTPDEKAWPKRRAQIDELSETDRSINADFYSFEEIENVGILARYRDWTFKEGGYDYVWTNYMVSARGINVGFISRVPIGPICVRKFDRLRAPGDDRVWQYARDLVSVTLEPASDLRIEAFLVHLKSKHDGENDPKSNHWRLAEAMGIHKIIADKLHADPDAMIAVMGDFNDTPDSATIQALLEGSLLIDPHASIPADQRISYLKNPYRSNIDYILCSPALAKCVVAGSAKLVERGEKTGSDHAAVTVQFDLPTADENPKANWPSPHPVEEIHTMMKEPEAAGSK
ncbi:MAG: hypothetical protein GC162_02550 [Planctomycetes bacterium]|nr:hypothetical protein [Planctomycetota bacterium]